MSSKQNLVFRLVRSHFQWADAPVLERKPKPLSKEYLDAIQGDIDAKLGPASERKPVGPPGW